MVTPSTGSGVHMAEVVNLFASMEMSHCPLWFALYPSSSSFIVQTWPRLLFSLMALILGVLARVRFSLWLCSGRLKYGSQVHDISPGRYSMGDYSSETSSVSSGRDNLPPQAGDLKTFHIMVQTAPLRPTQLPVQCCSYF